MYKFPNSLNFPHFLGKEKEKYKDSLTVGKEDRRIRCFNSVVFERMRPINKAANPQAGPNTVPCPSPCYLHTESPWFVVSCFPARDYETPLVALSVGTRVAK